MLPINLIVKPLSTTEVILCALIVLLGIAARYQRRAEPNQTVPKGSILSHREKARMLSAAQTFFVGMAFALFGAVLFITHEHAEYSHTRSTSLQITSTYSTAAPHENR